MSWRALQKAQEAGINSANKQVGNYAAAMQMQAEAARASHLLIVRSDNHFIDNAKRHVPAGSYDAIYGVNPDDDEQLVEKLGNPETKKVIIHADSSLDKDVAVISEAIEWAQTSSSDIVLACRSEPVAANYDARQGVEKIVYDTPASFLRTL